MSPTDEHLAGTTVANRYELQELIGEGGMAVIYKAIHGPTKKTIVLKMLRSNLTSTPRYLQHLMQESKALSSLSHPGVVSVMDFGVTGEGQPYILMEQIDGESLQKILERDKRISIERAVKLFGQACEVLSYAANHKTFHGDLKPSHL